MGRDKGLTGERAAGLDRAEVPSRPIRVLFGKDRLHETGGTLYLLEMLPHLDRARVEPLLCAFSGWHPIVRRFEAIGIHPIFFGRGRWNPLVMADLLGFVHRHRVDLLHLDGRPAFPFGRLAARLSNRPTLAHLHSMLPMPLAREILSRQPVFATSRAIAVSSAVRTWAVDRLPIAPDRIEVLHNGHDIERFASPSPEARARVRSELQLAPDAPVIGVIGRLDIGQKGQDVMIRALTTVRKRHPDARLLLVGDGPDRGACEGLVRQLGLGGAVRFAGYRSDIPDVLAAVDIVVIPSVCDEGLGFVAIEAGAAGRVVIATRSGGLPEVVLHNESGLVVPKGDVEALSTAVARVLSDPELARRLATNGQRLACRFTLREHVERLMAIYEAMVARPGNCAGSIQ